MPTAARLVASILFAALAWYVSEMVKELLPPEENPGRLSEINAVVGLILGWRVGGNKAGDTYTNAISYGLTTGAAVVFCCLFINASIEMLDRAFRKSYDGATEAVVGVFEIMIEYTAFLKDANVILTAVVGSIFAGLITEWFGRRFP